MKILISADMEGICGIDSYEQLRSSNPVTYQKSCALMTEEVNAVITGCKKAGATDIFVVDAHGSGTNLAKDTLQGQLVRKVHGGMMEGISSNYDCCLFVGYHGKAGVPGSFTAHTFSSKFFAGITINGVNVGEGVINALVAKSFGVKTVFLSGTDFSVREYNDGSDTNANAGVQTVVTKKSVAWDNAMSLDRLHVLKETEEKARLAVSNCSEIDFIEGNTDHVEMRIELVYPFLAEKMPYTIDGKTIVLSGSITEVYKEYPKILQLAKQRFSEVW